MCRVSAHSRNDRAQQQYEATVIRKRFSASQSLRSSNLRSKKKLENAYKICRSPLLTCSAENGAVGLR